MTYHIESRILTAQTTAVVRSSMPAAELRPWLAGVYEELNRYVAERGIRTSGPSFARYAFHEGIVDVEAGFPVPGPVPDHGRVTESRLPGGPVAVAVHHGDCHDLGLAYQAVTSWLKEHGLEAAGPHWDVYYTSLAVQPDTATWRTDVMAPYRVG